jgi:DNA-binding phage protein
VNDEPQSEFWNDLAVELSDPAALRRFITESVRIATIDEIVNSLDRARHDADLSKAELARMIGAEPATIRRLLSASSPNPTLGTLAEVAAALGLRVRLEPMSTTDRTAITDALRDGTPQAGTLALQGR